MKTRRSSWIEAPRTGDSSGCLRFQTNPLRMQRWKNVKRIKNLINKAELRKTGSSARQKPCGRSDDGRGRRSFLELMSLLRPHTPREDTLKPN